MDRLAEAGETYLYRALREAGDERAHALLEEAYRLLEIRSQKIADLELRNSFLQEAPDHRAILDAWRVENQVTANNANKHE